jgi:hypothetical protein
MSRVLRIALCVSIANLTWLSSFAAPPLTAHAMAGACGDGADYPAVKCPVVGNYTWSTPSGRQRSALPDIARKASAAVGVSNLPTDALTTIDLLTNEEANWIQAQVPLPSGMASPLREVVAMGGQAAVADSSYDSSSQRLTTVISLVPSNPTAAGAVTELDEITVVATSLADGSLVATATSRSGSTLSWSAPQSSGSCDVVCAVADFTVGAAGGLACLAGTVGLGAVVCVVAVAAAAAGTGYYCGEVCTDSTYGRPVTAGSECSNTLNNLPPKSCATSGQYDGEVFGASFTSLTYYVEWLQNGAVWENDICYVGSAPACYLWSTGDGGTGVLNEYNVEIVSGQPDCSDSWQAENFITVYFTRVYDGSTVAGTATSVSGVQC